MNENYTKFLLSPGFLIGLFALLANDFVLKAHFGNTLTGKLSDLAGLFIFPFFFSVLIPTRKQLFYLLSGLLFVLWKSPFSQVFIDLVNSFQVVRIGRVVDYTDFIALLILPLSYGYLLNCEKNDSAFLSSFKKGLIVVVSICSVFAFTATSFEQDRSVWLDTSYKFEMTQPEFETKLRSIEAVKDIEIEKTTDVWPADKYPKVETRPNEYYLRFKIAHKTCESPETWVFTSFQDNDESVQMESINITFWCSEAPTETTKLELVKMLDDTVYYPIAGRKDK